MRPNGSERKALVGAGPQRAKRRAGSDPDPNQCKSFYLTLITRQNRIPANSHSGPSSTNVRKLPDYAGPGFLPVVASPL